MQTPIQRKRRRGSTLLPRDRQQDKPLGFCSRCGRERYGTGPCPWCRKGAL